MSGIGPKCVKCKRQKHHHHPMTNGCPSGNVFIPFMIGSFFTPKPPRARSERIQPKAKRGGAESRKDRKVRQWTKSNPCCACLTKGSDFNPVDCAHIRTWKVTQSDHYANMVPLCRQCHRLQHDIGWGAFIADNANVRLYLEILGWTITKDPFSETRVVLSHPEVA